MMDTAAHFRTISLTMVLVLLAVCSAHAREIRVNIVDMAGQPLQGAVISLAVEGVSLVPRGTDAPVIMDQVAMRFSPRVLAINPGDHVSFLNSDNVRHHVYSFSEPKVFETKLYADKPDQPVQFDEPGLVVLGCNIHDSMLGYLYISEPGHVSGTTDENGSLQLQINGDISGAYIWHERLSLQETDRVMIDESKMEALRAGDNTYLITINTEIPRTDIAPNQTSSRSFGNAMRR